MIPGVLSYKIYLNFSFHIYKMLAVIDKLQKTVEGFK